ncbi:DUF6134 family protein [Pseudorhodoferax sp. Leaf274]|uniref:DUF6134 family protein n=1 Tax=Pseudorhodoferax sp. Leaf274 TaxID=1736318 RepID=UPI0007026CAE|nr:DUF6134 family protein [Pseudorhodoferax sp. Leaf274]KQP35290.1 hypothetical protein ASF44_18220 [Pseudorhodoferax sp. Leaf274]
MRIERSRLCALLLAALPGLAGAQEFGVTLDDQPIGTHRFTLGGTPQARTVRSEAAFAVKLLGLTVYRYRHQASEQWRGDCLAALDASTDDDGQPGKVQAQARGDVLQVTGPAGALSLPGCVMSYAYWNPAMRLQTQLLNAQTGRHEAVRIRRMDSGTVDVRGQPRSAERWRIEGPEQPIDVWYTPAGDWVGLDSTVRSGRQLRYRLH